MPVSAAIRALTPAVAAPPSPSPSILPSILSALRALPSSDAGARDPNTFPPAEAALPPLPVDPFARHLNARLVLDVLRSPQCQKDPISALHFFRWATSQPRFSPTATCYTAVVDLLLSHRKFSAAESLLPAVAAASATRSTHHDFLAAKFITAYGDLGDIRGAVHWFLCRRASLGRYSQGAVLRALVRANRVQLARAVFDQMVEEGRVPPDVSAYTTMIRGYCKLGLMGDAEKVFDAMTCRPNLITYNTLVDGYCMKGMMGSAMEAVDRMVQRDGCSPDTVTFTTLIGGFSRLGETAKARSCMEEMVHRWKLQPNLLTYNAVISGLCAAGDVESATAMMARMRLDAIKADLASHSCLVKGLCVAGRPDEAAERLREMARMGIAPDARAYGPVVKEYCRLRRLGDAMGELHEMRRLGVAPHISLFNTLLAALAEEGELDKAAWLLRDMPRRACPPNFLSFSFVITGLCGRRGSMGQVEELVAVMRRGGHRPDASMYSAMVEGYCSNGEMAMAVGVFQDMGEEGFAIRAGAFETLVKGLCSLGMVAEVRKVFDEMSKRLRVPNAQNHRRILDDHLPCGM